MTEGGIGILQRADKRPTVEPSRSPREHPLRLVAAQRRIRPALAIASIAVMAASVAVLANQFLLAGHKESVLAISRPIVVGQVVRAQDLKQVSISISGGLDPVPVGRLATVVGRHAALTLRPGQLLQISDLTNGPGPPVGDAIVGLAVSNTQIPSEGVFPGDTVEILGTPLPGSSQSNPDSDTSTGQTGSSDDGESNIIAGSVQVQAVSQSTSSSGPETIVSLLVPQSLAQAIANASALGDAALIVIAGPQ